MTSNAGKWLAGMMTLSSVSYQRPPDAGPQSGSVGEGEGRCGLGLAQERHAPGQLDRAQHRVMRGRSLEARSRRHVRADDDGGYVPYAVEVARALIPGDEQQGVGEGRARRDLGHKVLKEGVPRCDRTAVHVVDLVGDDHLEIGRGRVKAGQLGDVGATGWVAADRGVADRWVVLAGVVAGGSRAIGHGVGNAAEIATARKTLGVDVPGPAGGLNLVEEVWHAQVVGSVAVGSLQTTRCQGDVIGL